MRRRYNGPSTLSDEGKYDVKNLWGFFMLSELSVFALVLVFPMV